MISNRPRSWSRRVKHANCMAEKNEAEEEEVGEDRSDDVIRRKGGLWFCVWLWSDCARVEEGRKRKEEKRKKNCGESGEFGGAHTRNCPMFCFRALQQADSILRP